MKLLLAAVILACGAAAAEAPKSFAWSAPVADTLMARFPDPDAIHWQGQTNHFSWQAGYAMYTMEKLWRLTGERRYFDYIRRYVDQQVDDQGRIPGFEPTALIPSGAPGGYAEIELRWPHGSGGIIIRDTDRPVESWLYVVSPDPDHLYDRVNEAGLEITRPLEDTDYGNRIFTVVDPWSVRWGFGTYPGS